MAAERAEPLILSRGGASWRARSTPTSWATAFDANWSPRARVHRRRALGAQSRWCDDVRTQRGRVLRRDPGRLAAGGARRAAPALRRSGRAGTGARRTPRATATGRSRASRWLAPFFDFAVPSAGDTYTVNVGRSDFNDHAEPFANRHGASLRMLCDLGDPQARCSSTRAASRATRSRAHYRPSAPPGRAASTCRC